MIAPGTTSDGRLSAAAYRPDGSVIWETPLDATADDAGHVSAINAGQFLGGPDGPESAVAVSVYSRSRTQEGTFLLRGATGEIVWFKGTFNDINNVIRAYRPVGIPGAFDFDGDGVEEINMDMYSYMAMLNGVDGSFAFLRGTPNVRPPGEALYAAQLYNSSCPVYKDPSDDKPHWFVPLGHGTFGLMKPEPTDGIWREEVGYDVPDRVGMVDVDGDGTLEVGYALLHDTTFVCRDMWTGETKWELSLPKAPSGPVIAADVDGDGKGEFLVDRYCIGTDDAGRGELRWTSPVPLGWAVIADFDGDGKGEIACASNGRIYILKGD